MIQPANILRRHEFLIRRLHSLLGLAPVGGYLCFHLATNAAVIDGLETYQLRANQIHELGSTTIVVLEWSLIFLPILFHGLVGLLIVARGKANVRHYPYEANWRYMLQRATGVVAMVFILWHVFHMHGWLRFAWWTNYVAGPLGGAVFDPENVATAAAAVQGSTIVMIAYVVGVLTCVYHLANGLWTIGITWGVWGGPQSQRWAKIPAVGVGLTFAVIGLVALAAMWRVEL